VLSCDEEARTDKRGADMRIMDIFEFGGSGRGHGDRGNCGDGGDGSYGSRGGYSGGCSCRMNYGRDGSGGRAYGTGGYGAMSSRRGMGGY
jgi:hypothetical protein